MLIKSFGYLCHLGRIVRVFRISNPSEESQIVSILVSVLDELLIADDAVLPSGEFVVALVLAVI